MDLSNLLLFCVSLVSVSLGLHVSRSHDKCRGPNLDEAISSANNILEILMKIIQRDEAMKRYMEMPEHFRSMKHQIRSKIHIFNETHDTDGKWVSISFHSLSAELQTWINFHFSHVASSLKESNWKELSGNMELMMCQIQSYKYHLLLQKKLSFESPLVQPMMNVSEWKQCIQSPSTISPQAQSASFQPTYKTPLCYYYFLEKIADLAKALNNRVKHECQNSHRPHHKF